MTRLSEKAGAGAIGPVKNSSDAIVWLAVIALVLVPSILLGAGVIVSSIPYPQVAPLVQPVAAEITARNFSDSISVDLALKWSDGESVRAPAWSGIVTGAPSSTSQPIASGTHVVQIDGIWRVAAHTAAPFYRTLGEGDRGDDVAALNGLLRLLGFNSGSGSDWTSRTRRGVESFASSISVPKGLSARFDPSWVLWLPSETFAASSTDFRVGDPAPAQGVPVLTGHPVAVSSLISAVGVTIPSGKDQEWSLSMGELSVPYSGSADHPIADFRSLDAVSQGKPEKLKAVLRQANPVRAWGVPSTAIVTGAQGETCIYTHQVSEASRWIARKVRVVGGDVGRTQVSGTLATHISVLANPTDILGKDPCR